MKIEKSIGFVLKSHRSGEADILSTIFTREFGKRKFSFKGLKKSKKRPKNGGDPGTLLELVYYHNIEREISIINDFSIINNSLSIRNDLDKIYHQYFILELIDKTTGYNIQEDRIFSLLKAGLDTLYDTSNISHCSLFFLIHLMRIIGIQPDFGHCRLCGNSTERGLFLGSHDFLPQCGGCSNNDIFISKEISEYIILASSQKFSQVDHDKYSLPSIEQALFLLSLYIENYFQVSLKSKDFILGERK